MPFEVVFSQTPNLGNTKKIVELVPGPDGEKEIEVHRDDLETIHKITHLAEEVETETNDDQEQLDSDEEEVVISKDDEQVTKA